MRSHITTEDEQLRNIMLIQGVIFEQWVKLWFALWNSDMHTLEEKCFENLEKWVNFVGPPHHLWCEVKAKRLGDVIGDEFIMLIQNTCVSKKWIC